MLFCRSRSANLRLPVPECPHCRLDVSRISHWAQFCPGCGNSLQSKPALHRPTSIHPLARLRLMMRDRFIRPTAPPADVICMPILIGYSNALFRLGWRYERATGHVRNVREAIRCYRKSARLGNLDAMVRLSLNESPGQSAAPFTAPLITPPHPESLASRDCD